MVVPHRSVHFGALVLGIVVLAPARADHPDYPATRTVAVAEVLHGVRVPDPYRWLEQVDTPEVQRWIAAQNRLSRACLDQFTTERAALAGQLETLHTANVSSTPVRFGTRLFHTRRDGLQNHAVLYVRQGNLKAAPQVVVDPNKLSDDGSVALDWWYPSPDGRYVAYGISTDGSEQSVLHVRDVAAATDLPDVIPHTPHATLAWDADGGGFCYTRHPAPGTVPPGDEHYYRHIHHHRLGTNPKDDVKLYGEGRPKEEVADLTNSSDYRYQFLTISWGWARNDLYVRPAGTTEFTPVAVGLDGLFCADVLGDRLILLTDYEAPRYRILVTDVARPQPDNWQELIPEQKGVINGFVLADGKLVVRALENAYSRLFLYDAAGTLIKEIELPTLGSVTAISGRPDRSDLYFGFESFTYPPVVFRYDLREHTIQEIDRMKVGVDLTPYETKQVWFNSRDGTRVPMFVTHRKDLALDGNNPTVLWGYGGFNLSQTPSFYRAVLPWLDAGGVWAVANIRGGGEFGKEWHRAGQREHKQNGFDDFIAAAEKLIADRYTSPARLGARGSSNGGLLMGAMLTQRPDLFRAVVCEVPLLDMLRYHRFQIARFWIPEYGSAEKPEQFKYLYAYSPYHHVKADVAYPAVLFRTAESDTRVDPMHALKMTAALQAATSSDQPILLWIESQAGHGAGQPLRQYIARELDAWTFLMWQLGVFEEAPASQPATRPATRPAVEVPPASDNPSVP